MNFNRNIFKQETHAPLPPLPQNNSNLPPKMWVVRDQLRPGPLLRVFAKRKGPENDVIVKQGCQITVFLEQKL